MILTLFHKSARISLNIGPIWKIQKLTGSWEQARPAGQTGSIICPPARMFIRLGREDGPQWEHWLYTFLRIIQKYMFTEVKQAWCGT